jgi:hypothetical protein
LLATILSATSAFSFAHNLEQPWEAKQLKAPESVVYDMCSHLSFFPDVNGDPDAKDGNGFISTLKMDGSTIHF